MVLWEAIYPDGYLWSVAAGQANELRRLISGLVNV